MSAATIAGSNASPSVWRRLGHTPLRDMLRGRITGSLDWETIIREAALPAHLSRLVRGVVRATRLRRAEKVEVARELTGHFLDGLDAGVSAEQLIRSFGDEAIAARLIRRAKIRNRSVLWHVRHRAMQALGCAAAIIVVLFGVSAVRFAAGTPTIRRDYVAEVNARAAAQDGVRAWPLYREAWLKFENAGPPAEADRALADVFEARPGDASWPTAQAALARNAAILPLLFEASARPVMGAPLLETLDPELAAREGGAGRQSGEEKRWQGTLFGQLLPQLGWCRSFARLLAVDARAGLAAGEPARFVRAIEAMRSMARQCREPRFVVARLVGEAIDGLAVRECAAALRDDAGVLDEAAWRRLAHRLADAEPATDWDAEFEMESMAFEDIVQRAYTDNGRGDGRLTPAGARLLLAIASATRVDAAATWLAGTAASAWVGRAEMLREHRRHMEALRALNAQPLWNRDDRRANELMRQCGEAWYRAKYFPVAITLPALGEVSRRVQLAAARREALLIAIALELHRRREGAYPSSLGALVPALLPAVGRDPFDGRPLRYTLRDGRPVVYSIGADRDDDGGAAPSEAPVRGMIPAHEWISPDDAAARAGEIEDGDWILWPPANPPL